MWWNNTSCYKQNKMRSAPASNQSLITTQMMRLNEHSPCKVFGMLQNKHWASGSISRFKCHLRHLISVHPTPPTPPCAQAKLEFTILPHNPHTCLHSDHLTPSVLSKNPDPPPARITKQCNRKVCVNSCNIPAIFSKALRTFCRKPFMTFSNVPPTMLWRLWRWAWMCLLEWCRSRQDQIALPLLFRSPLRILMICEWVKWILVLLFKPLGSNHHFTANFSKAPITLNGTSGKLLA